MLTKNILFGPDVFLIETRCMNSPVNARLTRTRATNGQKWSWNSLFLDIFFFFLNFISLFTKKHNSNKKANLKYV